MRAKLDRFSAAAWGVGLRGGGLVGRFLLTLFIASQLGLAELGLYGLIASGATIVPSILGLGLNGVLSRHVVGRPLDECLPLLAGRLATTLVMHIAALPLAILVAVCVAPELGAIFFALTWAVLCLDNLAADVHAFLIARHRGELAGGLLFVRSGGWPLAFIASASIWPELRNMESVLAFWLAALVGCWGWLAISCWRQGRIAKMWPNLAWVRAQLGSSLPFHLYEMGSSLSQFIDRFLISAVLGLTAAGIYTFYWSLANAVNALVFFGVVQPYTPSFTAAARANDRQKQVRLMRELLTQVGLWAAGIAMAVSMALPVLLDALGKDQLRGFAWLLAVLMAAVVARLVADSTNLVLFAHHRDKLMAGITLCAAAFCSVGILAVGPSHGLMGVGCVALGTALLLGLSRATEAWRLLRS